MSAPHNMPGMSPASPPMKMPSKPTIKPLTPTSTPTSTPMQTTVPTSLPTPLPTPMPTPMPTPAPIIVSAPIPTPTEIPILGTTPRPDPMPTFAPTSTPMPIPMPTFTPIFIPTFVPMLVTAVPSLLTLLTTPSGSPTGSPTESLSEMPTVMEMPGMDHSNHADTMGMSDSMPMSMVMTFGKWEDYKLKLIFNSWDIQTKTQYFFSWVFVVLAVIAWHGLKHLQTTVVEENMKSVIQNSKIMSHDDSEFVNNNPQIQATKSNSGTNFLLPEGKASLNSRKFWIMRLTHSALSALMYGLALMLMLVAMTFNCGLFFALMVGYFVGDLIFFKSILGSHQGVQHACH